MIYLGDQRCSSGDQVNKGIKQHC